MGNNFSSFFDIFDSLYSLVTQPSLVCNKYICGRVWHKYVSISKILNCFSFVNYLGAESIYISSKGMVSNNFVQEGVFNRFLLKSNYSNIWYKIVWNNPFLLWNNIWYKTSVHYFVLNTSFNLIKLGSVFIFIQTLIYGKVISKFDRGK